MKPIFCGNFDFEARSSDLERLFRKYGRVDRVDMKSGYAFIYMDDERDAEYAIRALDRSEFGRKGRRLRVEWSKQERDARKSASSRRSVNLKPSKTLFVINFPYDTKTRDLERHFDPYGKIVNVRIRRNFAFVEYESLEDAIKALEATNMSKLQDRVISVEYSARGDDDRRGGGGYSPDRRVRDRSPDRRRSPSPYRRERGSPDYGAGSSPAYRRQRGSPEYGTRPSRSPRRVERSPKYGARSSRSPRRVERGYEYDNGSNRSPLQTSRHSPHYGRERSASPRHEERRSPGIRDRNQSPRRGERNGNGNGNGYGRRPSRSPEEGAISDDDAQEPGSPINKPDMRDRSPIKKPGFRDGSPIGEYGSPVYRYRSPSPLARERSRS